MSSQYILEALPTHPSNSPISYNAPSNTPFIILSKPSQYTLSIQGAAPSPLGGEGVKGRQEGYAHDGNLIHTLFAYTTTHAPSLHTHTHSVAYVHPPSTHTHTYAHTPPNHNQHHYDTITTTRRHAIF